jgi:hypothetical protein
LEAIKEKSECGMRSAEFDEGGIGNLSNAELGMRNAEKDRRLENQKIRRLEGEGIEDKKGLSGIPNRLNSQNH